MNLPTARTPATTQRRETEDAGSVTLFLVISVVGLLVLIGLVVDGGSKIRGIQRADNLAAEAGRAAGQAINVPAAIAGDPATVDRNDAAAAAAAYLRANRVHGQLTVSPDGRSLDIEVTSTSPTIFLGLIGITHLTVHGHATVTLVNGVTGAGT
jgi:hypothetical protein